MKSSQRMRRSGLAFILSGPAWFIGFAGMTRALLPVLSVAGGHWVLGVAGLLTLLGLFGLAPQVTRGAHRRVTIGYTLALLGAALFAAGNLAEVGLGLEFGTRLFGLGLVSLIIGMLLLSATLLRARMLPSWSVWPLIVGLLAIIPLINVATMLIGSDPGAAAARIGLILASTLLLGTGWMTLGYGFAIHPFQK